jgi:archaellum component FlaC
MTMEIGILIGIVGCFVGLAGWLSGRDKKIIADSEWRGKINAKLDSIDENTSGTKEKLNEIDCKVDEHAERIIAVESSVSSAHKRIDGLEAKVK